MGLLRLLLALSVFFAHAPPIGGIRLIGGRMAVETFYILAGFYMSLILHGKYRTHGPKTFWINRLWRLYPTYVAVFLCTLLFDLFFRSGTIKILLDMAANLHPLALIGILLSLLSMIGQDILLFLQFDWGIAGHATLTFAPKIAETAIPGYTFLLVPQAWAVSTEIWFYILAPFLVRRRLRVLVSLAILSLLLRTVLYYYFGFQQDPWTYRFFPSELALFLLGVVGFRLYEILKKKNIPTILSRIALIIAIAAILSEQYWPFREGVSLVIFYALLSFCIPYIFLKTKNEGWDRFLSDITYPLFLSHVLFLLFVDSLGVAGCLALTLFFSTCIVIFVEKPLGRWRMRKRNAPTPLITTLS